MMKKGILNYKFVYCVTYNITSLFGYNSMLLIVYFAAVAADNDG